MIHAHIFEYMQHAHYYAYRFIDEHRNEIEKIKKPSIYIVILKNGDEHHFLSRAVYDRWYRGRTYMIGDTLYHSDLPFMKVQEELIGWKKQKDVESFENIKDLISKHFDEVAELLKKLRGEQ